jgi:hypothetical protein
LTHGAPTIWADGVEVTMVNMDDPMVTATAVPASKRRRTARRRRVAISYTYRPFARRRMCSAYSCDQAHQAGDR